MTWTKADLVEFCLQAESNELKAIDRAIAAEIALRDHRAESLTIEKAAAAKAKQDVSL